MIEGNITPQAEDEISLKELILKIKEIWSYLWSNIKIIILVGLIGGILGLTVSLSKTPIYVAELSFAVDKKSSSGGLAALAGQLGLGGGSSEGIFAGANILELLRSKNMLERTLLNVVNVDGKPITLVDYYISLNPPKDDLLMPSFPANQGRSTFSREQNSTLNGLRNSITTNKLEVETVNKTSIVNISFKNEDEFFAKTFIEILVSEVSDFYIQTKTKTTKLSIAAMQRSADSLRLEYEKALTGRAILADQHRNLTQQVLSVDQMKYQTQIQLTGTAYAEITKNVEILKLDLARETPLISIIDNPILPLKIERLGKSKGIVVGGFIAGFLIISYLLGMYFYRQIMESEGE